MDLSGVSRRLSSNHIVLSDEEGPIHIFPHRDSRRTLVTLETRRALIVGCGVKGVERSLVERAVERVLEVHARLV